MSTLHQATLMLFIVTSLFSLVAGCGGESPESVFATAQFEEKQTNFKHAKELYQQIIREHPDSDWAKKAKERFEALEDLYPDS